MDDKAYTLDPQRRKYASKALTLIAIGIVFLCTFGSTVLERLRTEVDGVVISRQDIPRTGAPRYITEYVLSGPDGKQSVYVAGPTDAFLPRSMPVGTEIKKHRWDLNYERDGHRIEDYPITFYRIILGISLFLILWGITEWITDRSRHIRRARST